VLCDMVALLAAIGKKVSGDLRHLIRKPSMRFYLGTAVDAHGALHLAGCDVLLVRANSGAR